jgi:hypothetical protein
MISKYLGIDTGGIPLPKLRRELYLGMPRVIAFHKTSDEPNDDQPPRVGICRCDCPVQSCAVMGIALCHGSGNEIV